MKQNIDQILADIYTLEPELKAQDREVRTLIRELLKAKPEVLLDAHFASVLRERVLAQVMKSKVASSKPAHHDTLWWALRLAPIGVFAALTLALIGGPEQLEAPLTPEMIRDGFNTRTAPAPRELGAPDSGPAGTMMGKSSPGSVGGDSVVMSDAALMVESREMESDSVMDNAIFVSNQSSGNSVFIESLTLSAPGHIRVFAYRDGAPRAELGTSGVVSAGSHAAMQIPLSRTTYAGETLYAQLFSSNGDDVFTPYEDEPLRGESGELIYAIFMINSR